MINIDYSKDSLLDNFALDTLRERYMLPEEKSPQDAFARASIAFSGDDNELAQRIYDAASNLWFMFATPVLSNAPDSNGKTAGLPISCNLQYVEDSRRGLNAHWNEVTWLSSNGAGLGAYWGGVRSDGTSTSRGSKSTGIIPFMHVVDSQMLAVRQGTVRRGAYAAYLDISHPEIDEFLDMRKSTGGDIHRRNLNLHHGVNIPDSFMKLVESTDNDDWRLIDPHSKAVTKVVSAKELWRKILTLRYETGEPYLHFIDTTNRLSSDVHKTLGLRVYQSNLCVAPETLILTKDGYRAIKGLKNKKVTVWNGAEWSNVVIKKTGKRRKLIKISFSDGTTIDCTPYHKFYIQNDYHLPSKMMAAEQLCVGDKLEKWELPNDFKFGCCVKDYNLAYSQGFYSGDGNANMSYSWLYQEKYNCKNNLVGSFSEEHASCKRVTWNHGLMRSKDYVPVITDDFFTPSKGYVLAWLSGLLDADGTVVKSTNGDTIQLGSINKKFLLDVKLLLSLLGVHSKVTQSRDEGIREMPDGKGGSKEYFCQTNYRLLVTTSGTKKLLALGLSTFRLKFNNKQNPQRDAARFISVESIEDLGREDETYCATEPKKGRLCFNGVVTGNCSEITLPTGLDYDNNMRTAVCCLSSLNIEKYDEWKDTNLVRDLVTYLDNVLDYYINNAGEELVNATYSARMERSLGIGAMGFHAYLQKHNIPFDSAIAVGRTRTIFKQIREQAEEQTWKLGKERGNAPDYDKVYPHANDGPTKSMFKTGYRRNVYLLAIAPNASSSILCGNTSPGVEPFRANAFSQKTLNGTNILKNKYLDKILKDLYAPDYGYKGDKKGYNKAWKSIIDNNGSVQHLDVLSKEQKEVFKTAVEIPQEWIIEHAAHRQKYLDQAQSINLFLPANCSKKELHNLHFNAWKKGLKTLYYCRTEVGNRVENTNTRVERDKLGDNECLSCEG